MAFWDHIARVTGSAINPVLDRLKNVARDVFQDPVIGPVVPHLLFPLKNPPELFQWFADLAIASVAAGLSPAAAALIASYFQFLEVQASGKLKAIPEPLRGWLQPHYGVDLGNVYYAENINTIHGQAITVERHIYFPRPIDLNDCGDIKWLIHELQHCEQYRVLGGHVQFMVKYISQVAAELPAIIARLAQTGSFSSEEAHDRLGLEAEAIQKASTIGPGICQKVAGGPPLTPIPAPTTRFLLQTGTVLHETHEDFDFLLAPNQDLFAIKKQGTGTGTTEVHVLSAASNYQQFILQTGTALHPTDDTFAFAIAPNRDIFAIKKQGTGTGTTEVHVLSAASNYQQFILHTGTALHPTDRNWAFAVAPNRDVFVIKKQATGTNSTEVHVLSAASNYQQFSLQTGTRLHPTDDNWAFALAANRDVFAIKKEGGGTNTTEVHVLAAASNYQQFTLQTGTVLHPTGSNFAFAIAAQRDLFAIKKNATGTNSTEVHIVDLP
ncbi:hypothetical protein [Sorangium sp. So ce128]|uniref:hypothetical protein n=1 Tax=Sorangium sp. So ce128 TaxID=3133281 RepID=UPI003F63DE9E